MTASRDPDRLIRAFLEEGEVQLHDQVYDAVRAAIEQKRRRAFIGAWRTRDMNGFLKIALTAAAAVVIAIVGFNLLPGSSVPGGGPTATSEPSAADPSGSGDSGLPVGSHVMVSTVGLNEDRVTVTIPAPGWFAEPNEGSLTKDLGGANRVTVMTVPGDHYRVPRNICNWRATELDPGYRIADTVDQLVAYLAEQTYDTPEGLLTREFSAPVDITIGGHPGQSITGAVPGSDPDGCDEQRFCSLMDRDGGQCLLSHLEPNALVTLRISTPPDRNPPLWVVAESYWSTTGSELLAEMNAIVNSASPSEAPTSEFLPEGSFAWFEPTILSQPLTNLPSITVSIPASGWTCPGTGECLLSKGADAEGDLWMAGDLPESALLVTATTAGIVVYEDPCHWENDVPYPALMTAEEIAAALAAQPSRDASGPVDVTVGGYPGKVITLRVPDDDGYRHTNGGFTDCFRGIYATFTPEGSGAEGGASLPGRVHQGPGQIDTFWIVDVDGAIVIINAMYRADTPDDRIEEMRAIAESATFEVP